MCVYSVEMFICIYLKKKKKNHPLREAGDVCFVPLSGISGLSFDFPFPISSLSSPVALSVLPFLK